MIIAVDTGGTKTLVVAFSDTGEITDSLKFPTPRDTSEYILAVNQAIDSVLAGGALRGISIALPGVIRHQKAIICKNLGWRDFDVIGHLKQLRPDTPMWLENDANLGGLGASRLLPAQPGRCLYITVSTGVGGGFTIGGKIASEISEKEVGDITFEYNGQLVDWESIAGGVGIARDFGPVFNESTDETVKREVARRISRGLMSLLPVLRPEVVAIGGGLGARYNLISHYVDEELKVLAEQYLCPIVTSPHPEEIVAYGCYFNATDQLAG